MADTTSSERIQRNRGDEKKNEKGHRQGPIVFHRVLETVKNDVFLNCLL